VVSKHDAPVFGKDFDELMCCLRACVAVGFLMSLVATLIGCSAGPVTSPRDAADANDTGRKLGPSDELERALLAELPKLPSDAPRQIGRSTVVADPPYQAASGRTCRALHLTPAQKSDATLRLVCSDGKTWFFVPDVFASNPAAE
jgi:hypothetical protein